MVGAHLCRNGAVAPSEPRTVLLVFLDQSLEAGQYCAVQVALHVHEGMKYLPLRYIGPAESEGGGYGSRPTRSSKVMKCDCVSGGNMVSEMFTVSA